MCKIDFFGGTAVCPLTLHSEFSVSLQLKIFSINYVNPVMKKNMELNNPFEKIDASGEDLSHRGKEARERNATDETNKRREMMREKLRALYEAGEKPPVPEALINSHVRNKISEYIHGKISIPHGSGLWKEMEETVTSVSPHFKKNLLLLTSNRISIIEFQTAMLIKLGFSPTEMTVLTGRTKGTIVSRRDALCLKIFGDKHGTKFIDGIIRLL